MRTRRGADQPAAPTTLPSPPPLPRGGRAGPPPSRHATRRRRQRRRQRRRPPCCGSLLFSCGRAALRGGRRTLKPGPSPGPCPRPNAPRRAARGSEEVWGAGRGEARSHGCRPGRRRRWVAAGPGLASRRGEGVRGTLGSFPLTNASQPPSWARERRVGVWCVF